MRTATTSLFATLTALALLTAPGGCFSPNYPSDTGFACVEQEGNICPDGYECKSGKCVKPSGGSNPGSCLDEDLEKPTPNDTPQTATNLDGTLAGHPQGVSLYGVEICTPEDVDYYSFTVTTKKHALVVIQFQRANGELDAQLLDPSLAVLAQASPTTGGLQLEADMEPQSMPYYLVVKAGADGSKNQYDFSITFTNL
jgi:hypothetical protein